MIAEVIRDGDAGFTFHYASTLSYNLHDPIPVILFIYIPLCFYFIGKGSRGSAPRFRIYIPLCFYFIPFHLDCRFTRSHLHSTMLLLYPEIAFDISGVFMIYIPLCFYFICSKPLFSFISFNLHSTMLLLYPSACDIISLQAPGFTFHYASTLSPFSAQQRRLMHIYIPLCFYFIKNCLKLTMNETDLHSTMLLLYLFCHLPSSFLRIDLHSTMLLLYPISGLVRMPG